MYDSLFYLFFCVNVMNLVHNGVNIRREDSRTAMAN